MQLFEKTKYHNNNDELKIVDYIQDKNSLEESVNNEDTDNNILSPKAIGKQKTGFTLINRFIKDKPDDLKSKAKTKGSVIYRHGFNANLVMIKPLDNEKKEEIFEENEDDYSKGTLLNLKDNASILTNTGKGGDVLSELNNNIDVKQSINEVMNQLANMQPHVVKLPEHQIANNLKGNTTEFLNNEPLLIRPKYKDTMGTPVNVTPALLNPFRVNATGKIPINLPRKRSTSAISAFNSQKEASMNGSMNIISNNNEFIGTLLKKSQLEDTKIRSIKEGKLKLNVRMLLIDQLRYGQYAFEALCLLSSIQVKTLKHEYAEKICSYLLVFTTNIDAITKCTEPLLLIALAAEILMKISITNQKLKYKAETVVREILSLGENIQSSIKDEDMLNFYLKEQCDHHGRNALEIYAENRFYVLLDDLNVGLLVGKLWLGSGREYSLFKFFRMTRILMTNIIKEPYDSVVKEDYYPKSSLYIFQFHQYIKNCSMRFFFESFSVVFITILYQYVIYDYVTKTREDFDSLLTHESNYATLITNSLMCLSILNHFFLLIYYYKTGRQLKTNIPESCGNIILLIAIILNFIDLPQRLYPIESDVDMNILINGVIFSVIITMAWMRVIIILSSTNLYGPFLRITFNIFWHVLAFMLIVFCITFLFAQCFTLFFGKSNTEFKEFYMGFIALFGSAFGQCNFDAFTDLEIYGFVVLIAYTTLSNIMLFNLIVAIINNLFNSLGERAEAENRAMIILTYERLKWDNKYGLLILLPTPFNTFSLFLIPFLLFRKESIHEVNLVLSKICFAIIAVIHCLLLFLIGLVIYPIVLFKSIIHSSYDIWTFSQENKCSKILYCLLTRWVSLYGIFGKDIYIFWKILYNEPINNIVEEDNGVFLRKYVIALRKILNDSRFKDKKKVLPITELYTKLSLKKKQPKQENPVLTRLSSSDEISPPKQSNAKRQSTISICSNNSSEKNEIQEQMKNYFRNLIDKIVDTEGFIDIERTLLILPDRVKYSQTFMTNLKHMNIRVLIRGLTKFFFLNDLNNPIYSFKKLQLLVYKIMIKFKMMYYFIPEKTLTKINHNFQTLNTNPQFEKSAEALQKYEEMDDVSEYDDEGEYAKDLNHIEMQLGEMMKKSLLPSTRNNNSPNGQNNYDESPSSGDSNV